MFAVYTMLLRVLEEQHGITYKLLQLRNSMQQIKFDSTSQKHYPHLGSEVSSVWSVSACFSDIIGWGNQW